MILIAVHLILLFIIFIIIFSYSNSITLAAAIAKFNTDAGVTVTELHPPFRGGGFQPGFTQRIVVS